MKGLRIGDVYVTLGFDTEGDVRDRAIRFGTAADVVTDTLRDSYSEHRKYEMGGLVLASPMLSPSEVQTAVCNALLFPLSDTYRGLLLDWQAASWCRQPPRSTPLEGGVRLTGPLGRTALDRF